MDHWMATCIGFSVRYFQCVGSKKYPDMFVHIKGIYLVLRKSLACPILQDGVGADAELAQRKAPLEACISYQWYIT